MVIRLPAAFKPCVSLSAFTVSLVRGPLSHWWIRLTAPEANFTDLRSCFSAELWVCECATGRQNDTSVCIPATAMGCSPRLSYRYINQSSTSLDPRGFDKYFQWILFDLGNTSSELTLPSFVQTLCSGAVAEASFCWLSRADGRCLRNFASCYTTEIGKLYNPPPHPLHPPPELVQHSPICHFMSICSCLLPMQKSLKDMELASLTCGKLGKLVVFSDFLVSPVVFSAA